MHTRVRAAVTLVALSYVVSPAKAYAIDYTTWLNDRIDTVVAARINQSGTTNQTEAPTISGGSTTLVDRSAASDLVGISLNPPALSRSAAGDAETSSQVITLNPYTILAGIVGFDPLEPVRYQENQLWRRISLTVGLEEEEVGPSSLGAVRSTIVGAKLMLWNERFVDVSKLNQEGLLTALKRTGTAYGRVSEQIQQMLRAILSRKSHLILPQSEREFLNSLNDAEVFDAYLAALTAEELRHIDDLLLSVADEFVRLNQTANEVLEELRGQPQLSASFQGRIRDDGRDEYKLGVVFDVGLEGQWDWTLNAYVEFFEETDSLAQDVNGRISTEFSYRLGPEKIGDYEPLVFSVAVEGWLIEDAKGVLSLQTKLVIPIVSGATVPVSFEWANRSQRQDDDEALGRIGISIDTSKLLAVTR